MPEFAEVRITSDFINNEFGCRDVVRVEKSPLSKNKCDLSILDGKEWKLTSDARGKEMMLTFINGEEVHRMKIGFARLGSIEFFPIDKIEEPYFENRAMLRFYTADRVYFLSDFTRYVIWRWAEEWDANRSPDIVTEHNDWRAFMYKHRKIKYFKQPIFDLMCDQRFFSGIGNFSRSEILARIRCSPFTHFDEILEEEILREDFFHACKETLIAITALGGLQFVHWKNPFNVTTKGMDKWIRVYNKIIKAYYLRDKKGRMFWFEKKWKKDYVEWAEFKEVQDTRLLKKIYRIQKTKIKK